MIFPYLYILNASAGAGKTYQLSLRYIKLLLSGNRYSEIRNILAITFTNKAANEMRQRVLEVLKKIALKAPGYQGILKELGVQDSERISYMARKKLEEILLNYSEFYVRTIDSFVNSLVLASAFYLKIPPHTEIMQDSIEFLEFILDELLEQIQQDYKLLSLFKEFLKFYLEIEGKMSWYPKRDILRLIIQFHNQENIRAKDIEIIKSKRNFLELEEKIRDEFSQLLLQIKDAGFLTAKNSSLFFEKLTASTKEFLNSLKKFFDKISKLSLPQELTEKVEELKKMITLYVESFCIQRFIPYINIYKRFCNQLTDFKLKKRIIFLEELNRKANQLLKTDFSLIPEVYYRLSAVFYHFLIDEFQDTSILQWMNILPLIDEAISKGGSLFYVGDKKQAIYRFRGGNVELFEKVKEDFEGRVERIFSKSLRKNFRSKENIVKFNNSIFSVSNLENFLERLCLPSSYKNKILEVYRDCEQEFLETEEKKGGYVYLECIECKNSQEYFQLMKERLRELIEDLEKRYFYSDIGILLKKNEEVREITNFLIELNKPVDSEETVNIKENYLIKEIISFLNFLLRRSDSLWFAGFILGDIFLKQSKLNPCELREWLFKRDTDKPLYELFKRDFPSIWKYYIEEFLEKYEILPLYELVDLFLKKFKVLYNFSNQEAFFMHFLELIKDKEDKINNLRDFLEWWNTSQGPDFLLKISENLKGIKVMTIHKAKGLEFKVIILPKVVIETQIHLKTQNRVFKETQNSLYFMNISKTLSEFSLSLKEEYQKEYFYNLLDELNILYVAFTRASCELYAFFPKNVGRSRNIGTYLFFQDEKNRKEKGQKFKKMKKEKKEIFFKKPQIVVRREPFFYRLKDQLLSSQELVKEMISQSKLRGQIIHHVLSYVKKLPSRYEKFLENLTFKVCRLYNYSYPEQILSVLLKNFQNPKFKEFFVLEGEIFTEKEMVDSQGNLKRCDRLIIAPSRIILIDFKSGEEFSTEHIIQIREYATILKEIYFRGIESYLVYLDTGKIKRVAS